MTAIIDVLPCVEVEKEEIENKLLWYDIVDKGMRVFSGGKLTYEYVDFDGLEVLVPNMGWITGKTIAKVEKVYKNLSKLKTNVNKILEWISVNKEELDLEILYIDSREVAVSFNEKEKDNIDSSLYRESFRYEIKDA